jgi:anti-sigma regulatory factor (Ser/Thr protein kinase)
MLSPMEEIPNIRVTLSNRLENVLVVQQALSGLAGRLALDALDADDVKTAVTEVCKNVVWHAYEGEEGPLEVEIYALAGAIDVVVRDRGIGIRPHVGERSQPHTGIGLPMVHAHTQRVAFSKLAGGGTEVRMRFATPTAAALEPLDEDERAPDLSAGGESPAGIEIALAPDSVVRAVLPAVCGALASLAGFSAQRISDVKLLAGALVAGASDSMSASHLRLSASPSPGALKLRLGPLRAGSAGPLFDASAVALGPVTERLSADPRVAPCGSAETLELGLLDRGDGRRDPELPGARRWPPGTPASELR